MKTLSKRKILGQNLVRYAKTERDVLSYTRHPFIVNLNYAFQTITKLFLILDFCPGGDLGKIIAHERRFNEDRARLYAAEILLALQDLHKRDIIFRDLKPDNRISPRYIRPLSSVNLLSLCRALLMLPPAA